MLDLENITKGVLSPTTLGIGEKCKCDKNKEDTFSEFMNFVTKRIGQIMTKITLKKYPNYYKRKLRRNKK